MQKKVSAFKVKAEEAVRLLKTEGIESYTAYVVNWSSVYKYHWMMNAFTDALVKELRVEQ